MFVVVFVDSDSVSVSDSDADDDDLRWLFLVTLLGCSTSANRLMQLFKFYHNYFNESIKSSANNESNEIGIESLNKGDIVLPKTKSVSFLNSIRPEVSELIQIRWCRVKIKSNQDKVIRLYYCDSGQRKGYIESAKELDYKFVKPLAKIISVFLFEFHLDEVYLEAKLKESVKQNDLVDFN